MKKVRECGGRVIDTEKWDMCCTHVVAREDLTCLRGKDLMLIHGMVDKKVLLKNTLLLSKILAQQNILFDQQVILTQQAVAELVTSSVLKMGFE